MSIGLHIMGGGGGKKHSILGNDSSLLIAEILKENNCGFFHD